jgi:hypothetical protein
LRPRRYRQADAPSRTPTMCAPVPV